MPPPSVPGSDDLAVDVAKEGNGEAHGAQVPVSIVSIEPDSPWNNDSATSASRRNELADAIIQSNKPDDPAVVGVDNDASDANSGLDTQLLRRIDKRAYCYTPIAARSPVTWRQNASKLLFSDVSIAVVVTMYNESSAELHLTLRGIANNIRFMCKKLGQPDYWKNVTVTIVVDGRDRMPPSAIETLNSMRLIDQAAMDESLRTNPKMGMHLFETVASFADERDNSEFPPIQLMVAIKEINQGKIASKIAQSKSKATI